MIDDKKYCRNEVISFFKTDEEFGYLSNMKGRQKIFVNGIFFTSSEALYQAFKFPSRVDIQRKISQEKSPILAKRIASSNKQFIRTDWEEVKNDLMRLSIRIRALQSEEFYNILLSTGKQTIVEISRRDRYWGTIITDDNLLFGKNVLGRLLMELREEILSGLLYGRIKHILNKVSSIIIDGKMLTVDSIISDSEKSNLTFRNDRYPLSLRINTSLENEIVPKDSLWEESPQRD